VHPLLSRARLVSTATSRALRIGEAAARLGTTARTIRYYEEIGLLSGAVTRRDGAHRTYTEAEVERIGEILRLKDLLGLSLEAVRGILEAQDARRLLRARFERTDDPDEQREILSSALAHIDRQLALVRERVEQLGSFEAELHPIVTGNIELVDAETGQRRRVGATPAALADHRGHPVGGGGPDAALQGRRAAAARADGPLGRDGKA